MKKVTQIEVGGEIHNVVDSEGRLLLQNEVQRAKMAEDKIKADLQKVEEITEIGTKKLNSLLGDGEDSISGQIEKEISEVLQTSTDVFEKIEQISDWFEEDTTGSAALVDKVTNLENTKADKNGRYPDLSVGFSDNLVGRNETKESDFIFQPTANDWSVEDGAARIERVKGNTLVWNQIIDIDTYGAHHTKITKDGDAIIVTTMTEEDGIVYDDGKYDPYIDYRLNNYWITDHKYYFSVQGSVLDDETQSSFPVEGINPTIVTQIYGAKEGTQTRDWYYAEHSNFGNTGRSWRRWEIIVTGNASASYKLFRVKTQAPGVRFKYKEPLCIDLTRMFGAGNEPTTVAEFRAMFPEINPEKVEGRLVDFKGGKLETDGFNQLCLSECVEFKYDKDYSPQEPHPFKEGTWWNGIASNGYIRSSFKYTDVKIGNNSLSAISNGGHASGYGIGFPVRVIPGEKYYLNFNSPPGNVQDAVIGFFDAEGKYIHEDAQYNHTFTASPGAYWALIIFKATGKDSTVKLPMEFTDINLNLYHSGYRNGEVELGGEKDDITIDLSRIKDKEGNLVFPDGCLRSAGNIYDEIIGNKVIRRVGVIEDLGALDWVKQPSSNTNSGNIRFVVAKVEQLSNSAPVDQTIEPNIEIGAGFEIVLAGKTWYADTTYGIFSQSDKNLYLYHPNYQSYTVKKLKEEVLSGVKMYYELANPEVYELPEPLPLDYRVWDFGTEHFTPELGGSGLKADISYGFNAVDQIRANRDNIENILGVVGENGAAELNAKIDNVRDTLEEQKADKDGFYPTLTSGFSENLIGRGEAVEAEFTFRPSGGEQSIEDGVARIERIKGNTIVWNQLSKKYRSMSNSVLVDYDESTDIYTIKANPEHTKRIIQLSIDCYRDYLPYSIIKNHKYYISFYLADVTTINNSVYDFYITNTDGSTDYHPSIGFNHLIRTHNIEDRNNWYFNIGKRDFSENPWTGEEEYKLLGFPITIDLTLMFGAGNEPQTPEEFTAMFPNLSFSGHIPGELRHLSVEAIKTIGFNRLNLISREKTNFGENSLSPNIPKDFSEKYWYDGFSAVGRYDASKKYTIDYADNNSIKATFLTATPDTGGYGIGFPIRVLPNTTYTFKAKINVGKWNVMFATKDGLSLGYWELVDSSYKIPMPANCYWAIPVFIANDNSKKVDISDINISLTHSGYRDKEYEDYKEFTRQLPEIKEIFPGGLKQVGDVYDEITETQAIKRIGVVEDLSTLSWSFNKQGYFYSSDLSDIIANSERDVIPNILCPEFTTVNWDTLYDCKTNYSCSSVTSSINVGVSSIGIYFDSNITTVDALLPRIKNTPLYYELKNPEITTFSEPLNLSYEVCDFGTEEAVYDGNSAPFKADIVYGFNAVDTIRGNKLAIESLKENIPGLDNKIEAEDTDIVVESIEENLVTNALRKTAQVLTDAEKQQVQKNIGVDGLKSDINATVQTLKSDIDTEIIRAKNAEEILQSRYYNYLGNYPFSKKVLEVGADKMIIAGYLDIEYEEGKAYCFSVANPSNNALGLYKKEKDLPVGEANVTHVFNFVTSKIEGSPYYLAKPTYGNSPKSWFILDWDSVVKYYDSLYDFDGIALSPSLFKGGGLSGRIEQVYSELSESISAESNILNNRIISVEDELKDVYYSELDYNNSPVVNQFQKSNEVGAPLFSSSTFSGAAMYVGELAPFRYILSYFKSADWVESPKPITKMLLQIRQNDYTGAILHSQTIFINIKPGEVKAVLVDLGEIKTFTGNLYVALRADTYSTPMRPADDNYLFEPADGATYPKSYYWTHGDIAETSKGSAGYNAYNRNFYFQTFSEIEKIPFLTEHIIKDIESRLNLNPNIEISLPDKIYAVVGDTLQLFYRGMIKAVNPYNYDILVSCSKGKQTPRYFHYKPKAEDIGVIDFTLSVRDNSAKTIVSKTCKLHIVAAPKSPATKTNILCFGASNIAGGEWVKEVNRRLTKTGGTPAGNGLSNIEFCGSKKGDGAGWFGVGGWNWSSYISAGSPAFRFYVTGVESLSIGAVYTHNGFSYTIAEVNITEGVGNILCKTSSNSNTPTDGGILTKSSGEGDDTITFNEYIVDAQNPLWDAVNNKMSFIPYANEVANGQIDVVYTYLTWNGLSPNMEIGDFSTILSQAKKFADTLHTEFSNAKLKMMAQNPPSIQGGMGANYGASGNNYSDAYGMFRTILNMNDAYQEFANSEGYSDFVEFVNVSSQFDVENNMQSAEFTVNSRSSKKERLDTNGVHPANEGYMQIADVVYRNFVANFCQ